MKLFISLIAVVFTLAGCSTNKPENQKSSIGMANPASVYCEKIGGKLDIIDSPTGQFGNCTLPSGEIMEEWTLYRRDHQ